MLYVSMPICLRIAEKSDFLFLLCFINLVQVPHWLSINLRGRITLKVIGPRLSVLAVEGSLKM